MTLKNKMFIDMGEGGGEFDIVDVKAKLPVAS